MPGSPLEGDGGEKTAKGCCLRRKAAAGPGWDGEGDVGWGGGVHDCLLGWLLGVRDVEQVTPHLTPSQGMRLTFTC